MGKIHVTQEITCEFHAKTPSIADEFVDYLNDEYANIEFELIENVKDSYKASAIESAIGWYEPETMYEPAEEEVEFEVWEEDFKDMCRSFSDKYDDENIFCIDRVDCSLVEW